MAAARAVVLLAHLMRISGDGCDARQRVPEHVRPLDCALATLAASGLDRSATFRDLVARIGALNGIVYIQPTVIVQPDARRVVSAGLIHRVTWIGSRRVLLVVLNPGLGDRSVITMAHEFQHAIEVLSSTASTESEIDALFDRIGTRVGAGMTETTAAIAVERAVRREFFARRK
jgi:hypothetical protein